MYLDEFGFINVNLQKILNRLEKYHGTKLDLYDTSVEELTTIYEYYFAIKNNILQESVYNSYHSNPEYAKAILICEAIRIFLSEIAPGRKGKKVRKKSKVKESELAKQMFDELNSYTGAGKLLESATKVANDNNTNISVVFDAFKEFNNSIITENKDPDDPVYNEAMLFALDMIGNKTYQSFLRAAQSKAEDSKQLFKFLINKAKQMELGDDAKKFAYAAHSALINADLTKFAQDASLGKY